VTSFQSSSMNRWKATKRESRQRLTTRASLSINLADVLLSFVLYALSRLSAPCLSLHGPVSEDLDLKSTRSFLLLQDITSLPSKQDDGAAKLFRPNTTLQYGLKSECRHCSRVDRFRRMRVASRVIEIGHEFRVSVFVIPRQGRRH
jgi:hypothetical protein